MAALRRHQLARLTETGWCEVLAQPWDAQARAGLTHWARQHLPLVVTRQRDAAADSQPTLPKPDRLLALGLPMPQCWGRRRLGMEVARSAVHSVDEFAPAAAVTDLLPRDARAAWRALCDGLDRLGVTARVYGSYGWQALTGLVYLHADSDIDLCLIVDSAVSADAVADLLQGAAMQTPRIDGEIVFYDGQAVAWREWLPWRAGQAPRILVKQLAGVSLEEGNFWLPPGDRQGLAETASEALA